MATITQLKSELCTGCTACFHSCPRHCISMQQDTEGFLQPLVDAKQCVDCGLCVKACPVLSQETASHISTSYAAKAKDDFVRANSSSGGVFTLLAATVLSRGGVVFGAGLDSNCNIVHLAVEKTEDLAMLRGSKYVQSHLGNAFSEAKDYLEQGRLVMFTGTPCQIGGLYKFLKQPYDNLITQDIICHGVPSPMAWRKYVDQLERKYRSPICHVNFRCKTLGWKTSGIQIRFQNGKVYEQAKSKDPFMRSFLKDLSLRQSCYSCAFKKMVRLSDFTLADFWGIQHCIPEMEDNQGVSLVVCHTEKAKDLFGEISDKMIIAQADLNEAVKYNMAMCQSAQRPIQREGFMEEIKKEPFGKVVNRYCKLPSLFVRILRKAARILKSLMKRG